MKTKLEQAISAIQSDNYLYGQHLLDEIVETDPKNEQAWVWLSQVQEDNIHREHCLRKVLEINPNNYLVKKYLVQLKDSPGGPTIIGTPGDERGDQLVYRAFRQLPKDYVIYAQPTLVHKDKVAHPDYVIIAPDRGVIVVEVKDWSNIYEYNTTIAKLRYPITGEEKTETSPVEQARQAAFVLKDMLEQDSQLQQLTGKYKGKLKFPWIYAGILPNLATDKIAPLAEVWGEGFVLGRDDLKPECIVNKIAQIPTKFSGQVLTPHEVNRIRIIINPKNRVMDKSTNDVVGVYDTTQESIVVEPVKIVPPKPPKLMGFEEPQEVKEFSTASHIRLIRGFAGTGKTDVLLLRARYLQEQYPNFQILVTTFNKPVADNRLLPELKDLKPQVDVIRFHQLCHAIYRKKHGKPPKMNETQGIIAKLGVDHALVKELGIDFLTEQIEWLKENHYKNLIHLVGNKELDLAAKQEKFIAFFDRKGVDLAIKQKIFSVFELYRDELVDRLKGYDWAELPQIVLQDLEDLKHAVKLDKLYDAILIDEAQHFAPSWIQIVKYLLKPNGVLFICDDPSQGVYRNYSWKKKGIQVVGRTRWLRTPYRCTRQIFEAAYALIENNSLAKKLLAEAGEALPNINNPFVRDGKRPQAYRKSIHDERNFIITKVNELVKQGIKPNEIGILHENPIILKSFDLSALSGVHRYELKKQTGMEYRVVFIPQIQQLMNEENADKQCLKFYMAMTRARQELYLSYEKGWPAFLDPLLPFIDMNT